MSKTKQIFQDMMKGRHITSYDAFNRYKVTRLAALIFQLRKHGFRVATILKETKDGTRYAEYFIHKQNRQFNKEVRSKKNG